MNIDCIKCFAIEKKDKWEIYIKEEPNPTLLGEVYYNRTDELIFAPKQMGYKQFELHEIDTLMRYIDIANLKLRK